MFESIGGVLVIFGTATKLIGKIVNGDQEVFMKLYEIKNDLVETLDLFLECGEDELAIDNCKEIFEFLKEELKSKSNSILKYIRNLDSEKEIISTEIERLEKIKKSKESKIKRLKEYLLNIMLQLDSKKIETDIGSYGIRKSTKVDILDEDKIPNEFIKLKTERVIDKVAIGNYIKTNGEVSGARIIENYSLQIR